jgi:hypothetical protein
MEFEYSQDINTKQIEQMKTMEMGLTAITKQVDKFRAYMENVEMRVQGIFPCPHLTIKVLACVG